MTHPSFFDNKANIVKDDLISTVRSGDRMSVAAEVFSMYAYQELKEQLDGLDEFRFIFTSQAFTKKRPKRQEREFYIMAEDLRHNRRNSCRRSAASYG